MEKTFGDLGVATPIVEALAARGVEYPFAIQQLTIEDSLAGKDVCGKAETGSGKTLAFGVPAVQKVAAQRSESIAGLILVPTRELATQVHEQLEDLCKAMDIASVCVYGGANIEKQIDKLNKKADLLVATPGRLIDLLEREALSLADISIVILDEADRMADMGFMPQVEWLLRKVESDHQTLLFSATLDGAVDILVNRYQTDPVFHEVVSEEPTVEGMTHHFYAVHEMDKAKVVSAIVEPAARSIIFCNTKRNCDRLSKELEKLNVEAVTIHGDLRQRHREAAIKKISEGSAKVMVATDVAARGIHVDDVELVIHFDPPEDHKTYLHRSGRTARAGHDGVVVTLSLWDEELTTKRLQKRLQLEQDIKKVFSNNPELGSLVTG